MDRNLPLHEQIREVAGRVDRAVRESNVSMLLVALADVDQVRRATSALVVGGSLSPGAKTMLNEVASMLVEAQALAGAGDVAAARGRLLRASDRARG